MPKKILRSLLNSKLVVARASCLLIFGLIGAVEGIDLIRADNYALPTHRAVEGPSLPTSSNSILLVGLEPYLGQGTTDNFSAPPLHLVSAGGPLLLKDANGYKHEAVEITLAWRKVPLQKPYDLSRQVIGPFSSFESAQEVAVRLQELGLEPLVAHPKEWEVWIPKGVQLPKGISASSLHYKMRSEIRPYLLGLDGAQSLFGPIQIEAPYGLAWGGGVYSGPFLLQADSYGSWTLVEKVALEHYLRGVVPHEIGPASPSAALAAQTVLARTWALANSNRFLVDGYHLCSDTQCQVYKDPREANPEVLKAISATRGKVLTWNSRPINAVYHASNGGVMAAANEAWSIPPLPYLRAQLDGNLFWQDLFEFPIETKTELNSLLKNGDGAYGKDHPRFRWMLTLSAEEIGQSLNSFKVVEIFPKSVKVLERGSSGRALALEIVGIDEKTRIILRLDGIRRHLRKLPSTLFVVEEIEKGNWRFTGGGFGHGAGLSQAGAIEMAFNGWTTEEILSHYYPGTTYGPLQDFWKAP